MSRVTTYAYDLSGNLVTKGMPNLVSEQRAHDGRNRVSTLQNIPVGGGSSYLSAYTYGYDAAGNVMQVVETYPGGSLANRTITNTYDGVYRLTNEQIVTTGVGTVTTAYTYDKGNNRLTQVVTGGSGAGTTDYVVGNGSNGAGANQIISATLPDTTVVGFSYDGNGNRTQRTIGSNTGAYSYDYENRLVGLDYETGSSGTGTYGYAYDYRTRRVVRMEPGAGRTQIVFDGGLSIEEFGTAGPDSPVVEYLRGNGFGGGVGGLEYSVRSGSASFNQYDSRGDVAGQTNSAGVVTFQTAYEGFGEQTVTSGSTPDRQKANTKEEDPTGLLNEGFRYRDLETGTFITRDPIGFKGGPNMYTYVRQNPWSRFDPEGLDDKSNPPPIPPVKIKPKDTDPKFNQTPFDMSGLLKGAAALFEKAKGAVEQGINVADAAAKKAIHAVDQTAKKARAISVNTFQPPQPSKGSNYGPPITPEAAAFITKALNDSGGDYEKAMEIVTKDRQDETGDNNQNGDLSDVNRRDAQYFLRGAAAYDTGSFSYASDGEPVTRDSTLFDYAVIIYIGRKMIGIRPGDESPGTIQSMRAAFWGETYAREHPHTNNPPPSVGSFYPNSLYSH